VSNRPLIPDPRRWTCRFATPLNLYRITLAADHCTVPRGNMGFTAKPRLSSFGRHHSACRDRSLRCSRFGLHARTPPLWQRGSFFGKLFLRLRTLFDPSVRSGVVKNLPLAALFRSIHDELRIRGPVRKWTQTKFRAFVDGNNRAADRAAVHRGQFSVRLLCNSSQARPPTDTYTGIKQIRALVLICLGFHFTTIHRFVTAQRNSDVAEDVRHNGI